VLIKNGPHSENGKKFIDFMLRPETEIELAKVPRKFLCVRTCRRPMNSRTLRSKKCAACGSTYNALADLHDRLVQGLPQGLDGSE